MQNRVTYNVVKSCIDSITNKVAKNRPRPLFLTTKGDYSLKRRAKKLTQYLDGAFDSANIYQVGQKVFTDAATFGTGAMKIYTENGQVSVERVFIDELIVDDAEAMYGKPRQMHQKKYINRDVLMAMFPEFREKINAATLAKTWADKTIADSVVVLESWHLRSDPQQETKHDGRHTITIENCTLLDEEYTKDVFPFVFLRWTEALLGFFGTGLAEELTGIQLEINKILRNIQKAMNLVAVPRTYMQNESKIVSQHINNTIGAIVKHTGNPPTFHTPQAYPPEIYQHLERLYAKAFEITGVSMLSATSKKPSGLDSGAALREYNDIETERFLTIAQRYERFYIEIAKIFIDQTRDLSLNGETLTVKSPGKKFLETIKWKDVDMKEDKYSLRVFPTSLLPTTPAGRLEKVQELIQSGMISQEHALSLLDFPDLDKYISLETASQDNVQMLIEKMIEEGEYESPEAYLNLEAAIKETQNAYLRAKLENVPEDRRELLQRFIEECVELIPQPPQPELPPLPVEEPPAVPEAPPVSDLLPI